MSHTSSAMAVFEVIVRAFVQALDAVFHAVAGGEHDDRRLLDGAQRAQHREAVLPRQHDVQHDHVVLVRERQVLAVDAVVRHVDRAALLGQPLGEVVRGSQLVFDNQDLHAFVSLHSAGT
jgi:hypothetical protein